jgi:hypothetical protein
MMKSIKNHFNATRFDFQLHFHTLQPWPAGNKAVAIGWQRGKKRRGATGSVMPLPAPGGGGGTLVRFNERVSFKATLYKVRGGRLEERAAVQRLYANAKQRGH